MKILAALSSIAVMALVACSQAPSTSSTMATKKNYCNNGEVKGINDMTVCKNIPANRRDSLGAQVAGGNPVALASKDGNLFIYYVLAGEKLQKCQITSRVAEFKISQHKKDIDTAYYVTNDKDLFRFSVGGTVGAGKCPAAKKANMLAASGLGGKVVTGNNGPIWGLIPNANANAVGLALTTTGMLEWTATSYVPYEDTVWEQFTSYDYDRRFDELNAGF